MEDDKKMKAATKAKNKYRDKAYDRIELIVPKGMKQKIETLAQDVNCSKNGYIIEAVKEKCLRDTGKELRM